MKQLHEWFQKNQREFPWRQDRSPYKVWVSEVMLQQTRASVVVPYFLRWMDQFPNVRALAAAPLEKVIKTWEGLGYYSRARNLHAGALQIVQEFDGELPSTRSELKRIQGVGDYTVGAILSFGFQQRSPAVDGNVTRVLSRYFLIEENVCKQPVKRKIQEKAEELLDCKEPWVTAEALIELGATICTPRPKCIDCPIQKNCLGFLQNKADSLPIKNESEKAIDLRRTVALIEFEDEVLLKKGKQGQVMADLWELPYFEMGKENWTKKKWLMKIKRELGLQVLAVQKLSEVEHTFTRYRAHLYPIYFKANRKIEIEGYFWIPQKKLCELPFSSGHRKIIAEFIRHFA